MLTSCDYNANPWSDTVCFPTVASFQGLKLFQAQINLRALLVYILVGDFVKKETERKLVYNFKKYGFS